MERSDINLLIETYGDSLYRYCKGITYTLEDAEDLYQQTFLKALELHKKINPDKNPQSYLMSIATNLWRNHKSMYARRERIAPTISTETEGLQLANVQNGENILDEVVRKEEYSRLRRCVNHLPDKQRQVILLFYAGNMPIEDIAKMLKIPKGTVKSRLNKARQCLRREMEGDGNGTGYTT